MVYIICGEKDQGKTERIQRIYQEEYVGDGFITQKIFSDSVFTGYTIKRLSTDESLVQSMKREYFPPNKDPFLSCGSFDFYKEGFLFADRIINDIIDKGIDPVFIDEIGPIELSGKGHHDCFKRILKENRIIYVTVRNSCVEKVISYFSIKRYTLLQL